MLKAFFSIFGTLFLVVLLFFSTLFALYILPELYIGGFRTDVATRTTADASKNDLLLVRNRAPEAIQPGDVIVHLPFATDDLRTVYVSMVQQATQPEEGAPVYTLGNNTNVHYGIVKGVKAGAVPMLGGVVALPLPGKLMILGTLLALTLLFWVAAARIGRPQKQKKAQKAAKNTAGGPTSAPSEDKKDTATERTQYVRPGRHP